MKRKVLAFFLAALMLVSLFPAAAASGTSMIPCFAVDTISTSSDVTSARVVSDLDGSRRVFDYYVPSGGVTALIFFDAMHSENFFESLAEQEWIKDSRVNLVAVESSGFTEAWLIESLMREYTGTARKYFTVYYDNTDLQYEYLKLLGSSAGSLQQPFVLLVTESSGDRYIDYYGMGISDGSALRNPISNLISGIYEGPSTPPANSVVLQVFGEENWEYSSRIYELINRRRTDRGMSSLQLSDSLCEAAMQRAAELAVYNDDDRPNGLPFTTLLTGSTFSSVSESILDTSLSYDAYDCFRIWTSRSDDESKMLNSSANRIGVGCFITDDRIYCVAIYGNGSGATRYPSYTAENKTYYVETSQYNVNFTMEKGDRDITMSVGDTASFVFGNENEYGEYFTRIVPKVNSGYPVVEVDTDKDGNTVITGLTEGETTLTFKAYNGQRDGFTVHVTVKGRNLEGECGESATYYQDFSAGTLTVSGTGPMTNYTVKKPPAWEVKAIKTLNVRNGITHVGNKAFASASNLTSISLPKSLVSIGTEAFYGAAITRVSIPSSVVSIANDAFAGCKYLKDVYYSGTREMWEQVVTDTTDFSGVTIHYGKESFPNSGLIGKTLTWSYDAASGTLVILGSGSSWSGSAPQPFDIFADDIHTLVLRTGVEDLKSGILDALDELEKVTVGASTTSISIPHVSHLKELRLEGGTAQWETLQKQITLPTGCTLILENRDGTVQKETSDGKINLVTVEDADGNVVSMEATIYRSPNTTTVTLPEKLPANTTVRVVNDSVQPVEVMVPVQKSAPGIVLTRKDTSGAMNVIRDCVDREGGLVFTIAGGTYETIAVVDNTETFTDVQGVGHWSKDAVEFVVARKLFNGTGNGKFEPMTTMTRGLVVTVLYHLANDPAAGDANFSDVNPGDLWYKPVAWATANGIISGYPDGTFGGEDNLTREQLVTVLYRYAIWMGYDVSATASIAGFSDAGTVGDFAQKAVQWAVAIDLIHGTGNNMLSPKLEVTRAEVATIVRNYCDVVIHSENP